MIISATDNDFKNEVEDYPGLVFVDCWSPSCAPCMMMMPVIEGAAKRYPNVKIVKVEISKNMQTAVKLMIQAIPTIVVYKGGKIVDRSVGYKDSKGFEDLIKKHTAHSSMA
jgi:thioredoxin 1